MREPRAERAPELLGEVGILQHQRALQITIAVQPGRQLEVPVQQRPRLAEEIENLCVGHIRHSVLPVWIGQVAAIAALMPLMLCAAGR